MVLSRVMCKYNSVTYEVGKAKAEHARGLDKVQLSCANSRTGGLKTVPPKNKGQGQRHLEE